MLPQSSSEQGASPMPYTSAFVIALPGGEANSARAYETLLGAEQWELDGARGTARVGDCILRAKAHGGVCGCWV